MNLPLTPSTTKNPKHILVLGLYFLLPASISLTYVCSKAYVCYYAPCPSGKRSVQRKQFTVIMSFLRLKPKIEQKHTPPPHPPRYAQLETKVIAISQLYLLGIGSTYRVTAFGPVRWYNLKSGDKQSWVRRKKTALNYFL